MIHDGLLGSGGKRVSRTRQLGTDGGVILSSHLQMGASRDQRLRDLEVIHIE